MKGIPSIFKRFANQIWYFVGIPVFFYLFMLVYRPFELRDFFDASRDLYAFNITMLMCIVLACLAITRIVYYFIWRRREMPLAGYISWCVMETAVCGAFISLFMWLISRRTIPYMQVLGISEEVAFLTMLFPYVLITLAMYYLSNEGTQMAEEDSLVRFTDQNQRLKLVIASSAILYLEAEENYVRIHYMENENEKDYVLRNSMKGLEELVGRHGMIRSHRSYFINPAHIKVLRKDKEGSIIAELDVAAKEIPVSKRYYDQLSALL